MCLTGALTAAALGSGSALAQQVALDRFEPAPAGDRMFGVESPFAAGEGVPHVSLLFDYAHNPYTLRHGPGLTDPGAVVGDQMFLHLNVSIAILNRVNLNFEVPAAVAQDGSDPTDGRTVYTSPHEAQFGDVRLGARVNLYGNYNDPFQLALSGYIWVPTGASNSYVSDGKVRGMPSLIMGGRTERLVWSFASGVQFRPTQTINTDIQQGIQVHLGAGMGFLFNDGKAQIGPEVKVILVPKKVDLKSTNAEALVSARYRLFDDFELGLGAGPGLTSGFGTPDVRVIGMLAFTPKMKPPAPPDRDADGVPDAEDACPDVAAPREANPAKPGCPAAPDRDGDKVADDVDACPDKAGVASPDPAKNGCPADRDGDGIPDDVDACPDAAGVQSSDAAKNGCPLPKDADGDGIPDSEDACPNAAGMKSSDPKQNGCPGDRDGDGIRDDLDACPDVKGVPSKDPKKNGCPRAQVSEKEININEQVEFDTGKATIRPTSDQLVEEIAGIFKEHTEILKVEVQGHTDNAGPKVMNKQLSQARADAVKKALVKKGIAATRLVAKGYGEEKPIADNATEEGRATNRRVQFVILEKKAQGAAEPAKPKAPPAPKAPAPKAPAPPKKK
jgi:outer membrane protein OmpA-like peptidoglycan-associated protein